MFTIILISLGAAIVVGTVVQPSADAVIRRASSSARPETVSARSSANASGSPS